MKNDSVLGLFSVSSAYCLRRSGSHPKLCVVNSVLELCEVSISGKQWDEVWNIISGIGTACAYTSLEAKLGVFGEPQVSIMSNGIRQQGQDSAQKWQPEDLGLFAERIGSHCRFGARRE